MVKNEKNYLQEAKDAAREMVENFLDEVVDQLIEDNEASTDFANDYSGGDSYHHETHIDKDYDLQEAASLLDDLSEYEETDEGLWDGQSPREAISTQAAYTYSNAVADFWRQLVEKINADDTVQDIVTTIPADPLEKEDDGEDVGNIEDVLLAELVLAASDQDSFGVAADRAEEIGSPWAEQLRECVHLAALEQAKRFLLNRRIKEILGGE